MEKILDSISQTDDFCGSNLSIQQYQELSTFLKQRTHLYREENACLERLLADLRSLNDDVKLASGNYSSLEDIQTASEQFQLKSSNNNSLALSQAERLRKHNNYVSKLKTCIKLYMNLNEKLLKHLKFTKCELKQAKTKIQSIINVRVQEIQELEEKAKRYERDLMKFEHKAIRCNVNGKPKYTSLNGLTFFFAAVIQKKYPWLKDHNMDLPNIAKEIDMLRSLRDTREKLVQELSIYEGLKPELKEASQQLADIKEEHSRFISEKFN